MILSQAHSCKKMGGASIGRRASNGTNTVYKVSEGGLIYDSILIILFKDF